MLNHVNVTDDLSATFPSPAVFSISELPVTTGTLTANPAYNGSTDINLLNSASSILDTGHMGTITFMVNVKINSPSPVTFYNSATGFGRSAVTDILVTDISNAGELPDVNHDGNGNCPEENTATSFELSPMSLFIPAAFSPNSDGLNDLFVIPGIGNYPDCELTVYNRWGNRVYYMKGYDNSWDATPEDNSLLAGRQKVPAGTYYYILEMHHDDMPDRYGFVVIKY
jgi:gliding motility-associated-like protein